ncbi:MAG: tRNA pseudouridine(55) synthase TruB [Parachlamydia sp.]|jgi:tRNA pseudouridine55 synthase|nr:tRNA pseudouridine(55) synthase TruB [Parachlamydia sp.]
MNLPDSTKGILLVDKPRGKTSFDLVRLLRKRLGVKKIGHAGTLDPFATGVMVMLIGREYTRLSDQFLNCEKEYEARLNLGQATDTFDCEGKVTFQSATIHSLEQVENVISSFQGDILQTPPMYSAKKKDGKKLYELARQGIEVEREAVKVHVEIHLLNYAFPYLDIKVRCSKGTYIRSLAHDIGLQLGCGAHLIQLMRTRSGAFLLQDCLDGSTLAEREDIKEHLLSHENA